MHCPYKHPLAIIFLFPFFFAFAHRIPTFEKVYKKYIILRNVPFIINKIKKNKKV